MTTTEPILRIVLPDVPRGERLTLKADINLAAAVSLQGSKPPPSGSWRAVSAHSELPIRISKRPAPRNPTVFDAAQDHVPAAYCVKRGFLTPKETAELDSWFSDGTHPSLRTTSFSGEDLGAAASGAEVIDGVGGPIVRQLYRNPQPFIERFPWAYARLLSLADRVGTAIGLDAAELERVRFCNDIRHITYKAPADGCPWHRDDPASHFNTIVMLTQPGEDFDGGNLLLHPGPCVDPSDAASVRLELGDAIIYTAPLTDHMVETVTRGVRRICLTELQLEP